MRRAVKATEGMDNITGDVIYDIMIVVDTNVVVSGLRSRQGASNLILNNMLSGRTQFA